MVDPTVLVSVIGLVGGVCSYLAGRNRWLAQASKDLAEAYEQLLGDLRREIDRLKLEVAELRTLLTSKSRTSQKS